MINSKGGTHPASLPSRSLIHTHQRTSKLHELVDCTPTILHQYFSIRLDEILSSAFHEYINASSLSNLVSESAWIHDDSFTTLPDLGGDKDSPEFLMLII